MRILLWTAILLLHPGPVRAGDADCPGFLKAIVKKAKAFYSSSAAEDLSDSVQWFRNPKTGEEFELCLSERVGTGTRGAVYRISYGTDGVPKVAKIEKGFRLPMLPKHKMVVKEGIERELKVSTVLAESISAIESAPSFPKSAPWKKGAFPVVPILETLEGPGGLVLIKPEIGNPLKVEHLELTAGGRLSPAIDQGLREVYALQQAVHEVVKSIDNPAEGMFLDIGPSNIFWVESPADLKKFGMSRPGFQFFEVDQGGVVTGNPPVLNRNHQYFPSYAEYRMAVILHIRAFRK
jgi:hypothetical protein